MSTFHFFHGIFCHQELFKLCVVAPMVTLPPQFTYLLISVFILWSETYSRLKLIECIVNI